MITEPAYWLWYDDSPKRSVEAKLADAIAAYTERFQTTPNIVLVRDAITAPRADVAIRQVEYVQRHCFWLGREDENGALQPLSAPAVVAPALPNPTRRRQRAA